MIGKTFLQITPLMSIILLSGHLRAQELKGDEKKSMDKYAAVKGKNGVIAPELRLPAEKMKWWQDAKFGMFIHWGLYAIPGKGEWVMNNDKIPAAEYAKLADQFNPQHFDANAWASLACDAGMKYMVLTARHHDGFALWNSPSSYGHFTSFETAAHRDVVKEYTDACRKAGLGVGIYYSPMDWRFPGYFKPVELAENAALMKQQGYGQVEELVKNYGKIDVLWYDGGWLAHTGTDADAAWFWEPVKLNTMVRHYQPDAVISPRSGWEGDFQCNEGDAKVTGPIIPTPWEKCLNLNRGSWGYHADQHLMTLKDIIVMLVNTVDRGGNMLLNVGPDPDGVIPENQVALLKEVGAWLQQHGEGIYGTRPGPFEPVEDVYGAVQRDNLIYLHVQQVKDTLQLPPLPGRIAACRKLSGETIVFRQDEKGIALFMKDILPDPVVTTLVLEMK